MPHLNLKFGRHHLAEPRTSQENSSHEHEDTLPSVKPPPTKERTFRRKFRSYSRGPSGDPPPSGKYQSAVEPLSPSQRTIQRRRTFLIGRSGRKQEKRKTNPAPEEFLRKSSSREFSSDTSSLVSVVLAHDDSHSEVQTSRLSRFESQINQLTRRESCAGSILTRRESLWRNSPPNPQRRKSVHPRPHEDSSPEPSASAVYSPLYTKISPPTPVHSENMAEGNQVAVELGSYSCQLGNQVRFSPKINVVNGLNKISASNDFGDFYPSPKNRSTRGGSISPTTTAACPSPPSSPGSEWSPVNTHFTGSLSSFTSASPLFNSSPTASPFLSSPSENTHNRSFTRRRSSVLTLFGRKRSSASPTSATRPHRSFLTLTREEKEMGAAMRKQCCGGRDDDSVKAKAKELNDETGTDDIAAFDIALEKSDVPALVALLDSEKAIEKLSTRIHPWAATPKSVCSLAATQLAIFASKEDEPHWRDDIRTAGGIPKLVKFLSSAEEDRVHAAVVCLSFLSVDNVQNCVAMFEAGCMPLLVDGMLSSTGGMQAACAQTCRNIYVNDEMYRQQFAACGGIPNLVALLELPSGKYDPLQLFNQVEASYHIEDLILESGAELPEFVKMVKDAGAVRRLQALSKIGTQNSDLSQVVESLLIRLSD